MNYETLIGLAAGILTTISFVPQVWKIWKSRSAEDISYSMYFIFATGVFLWLIYGVLIASIPIIANNLLVFGLALFILLLKARLEAAHARQTTEDRLVAQDKLLDQ